MLARVPFVSFVIFFISGILVNEYAIPDTVNNIVIFAALMLIIAALSLFFYFKKSNLYFGISFSLFLATAGAFAASLQNDLLKSDLEILSKTQYSSYEAIIKSLPEKRANSIRLEATITRIRSRDRWENIDVKALISIPSDASFIPKPGNVIVVNGNVDRAGKALNPEEFDYQRYLWNKGIVWTDYLREESYQYLAAKTPSFSPALWSIEISEWADRTFRINIKNDLSYGLVKAMLLGRRDDLHSDQVDDYTASGTVHILSVSGMHVAIIFLLISSALSWMKRWKIGKFAYLVCVIALLFFYALVTGLPPSVQRATLMCVVFVIEEAFGRKQNSINTLAIAALLILMLDPRALYDVGFQLSFLAMCGIFLLYEPIEIIWRPENTVLKYVWQITALSFAAQLATFPLSLYYFHQFPFYFWLVNPFVIFFTNFLLPASMVLLLTSLTGFSWLQEIVNWWVEVSAYLTNISVSVPKLLPGYLIENLYLDKMEVSLLYVFLFIIWYSYYKQEYLFLKRSAMVALLFFCYSLARSTQSYFSSVAIIHAVPNHSVISFKEGNKLFIISDRAFESDTSSYKFHIKNYAISQGISEPVYISDTFYFKENSLKIKNLVDGSLLYWKGTLIYYGKNSDVSIPVNYALITAVNPPDFLETGINSKATVLLGGEIRGKKRDKWKQFLASNNINYYDQSNGYLLLH